MQVSASDAESLCLDEESDYSEILSESNSEEEIKFEKFDNFALDICCETI